MADSDSPIPMPDRHSPVFIDHTGRRWRRIRRAALVVGVASTVIALFLVGSIVLNPPVPPELPLATANNQPIPRPTTGKPGQFTRVDRLRTAYRRKLAAIVRKYGTSKSRRPDMVPALSVAGAPPRRDAIVAGFYVNWADNSFSSLTQHIDKLDWVIGEWAFVPANGDSLQLRVDRRVIDLLASRPPESRPALFIMLSNFVVAGGDSAGGRFDAKVMSRFLADPVARANAVRQLRDAVLKYGLAGTTLDLEGFDASQQPQVLAFARELRDSMHGIGRLATQAVAAGDDDAYVRQAGQL